MFVGVIKDYEKIADEINYERALKKIKSPTIYPWFIWNFCMRQIVFKLEDRVNRYTGISKSFSEAFYEPFNIVSFAAVVGKTYQKEKAKEWVSELGAIINDRRIDPMIKIQFIAEHLRTPEREIVFSDFKNIHDDFGFHFDFEQVRKKVH